MEVVYLGLRNTPARIAQVAVEEDVDVVGLSVLLARTSLWRAKRPRLSGRPGADDIPVVISDRGVGVG